MKAFVHVGTEKTGTTTIQHFLGKNRQLLLEDGFLYPHSPEEEGTFKIVKFGHTKLPAFSMDSGRIEDIQKFLQLTDPEKLSQFRDKLKREIDREVSETNVKTVVFSSEHCSSRLVNKSEIERLYNLLKNFFEDIKIIIYIRRQDKFLLSTYSTAVRCGRTEAFSLPCQEVIDKRYDYWKILKKWESVFGKENIIVRVFEPQQMIEGNLLSDFANILGIDITKRYKSVKNLNSSLDVHSLDFLRLVNHYVPRFTGSDINQGRAQLLKSIETYSQYYSDKMSFSLSRKMYENFMANFERSNQQVARYFLNRSNGKLFASDFPNQKSSPIKSLSMKKAFEITTYLLKDKIKQVTNISP